jgi:hypothetical protein
MPCGLTNVSHDAFAQTTAAALVGIRSLAGAFCRSPGKRKSGCVRQGMLRAETG